MSTVFFGSVNTPNLGAHRLALLSDHGRDRDAGLVVGAGTSPRSGNTCERRARTRRRSIRWVSPSRRCVTPACCCRRALGVGGSALAPRIGQFIGSGDTMVQGRVHRHRRVPVRQLPQPARDARRGRCCSGSTIQIRLQQLGYPIPDTLVQTIPYVVVILVLVWSAAIVPEAAGEHYETED